MGGYKVLINCKVRQWQGRVIYIAILSLNTGVYTVCHLNTESDSFSGYSLVDSSSFDVSSDVINGYLYSNKGLLAPKAVLYRYPDPDDWKIYIPHIGLSTTFPNEPTEKNVKAFLEGLRAC